MDEGPQPQFLGALLRQHRRRANLTQDQLARRCGLSVRAVRDLESGRVSTPRAQSLVRPSAGLGLSPAQTAELLHRDVPALHIGILGPLTVRRAGVGADVGPPAHRTLLGLLALHSGEVVGRDEIVDILWGDRPPRTAVGQVQSAISRLRRLLDGGASRVHTARHGYRLSLAAGELDAAEFTELLTAGRLQEALSCWRGPVLAEAPERLRTLHARLVVALARDGDRTAAVRAYGDIADRLAEELGVPPGDELRAAYRQVAGADQPSRVRPAQLPAPATGFVGRTDALQRLEGARSAVSVITGTAGVGKTTLALQWAHSVRASYPDGQLFADLHGFDPSGMIAAPSAVLRCFLEALGVSAGRMPASLDAQVGLYRSLLAGQRMLVVLDNARDADHVRPLLPGVPGCRVVITSRDQLRGLVAAEGAEPVVLDLLSVGDAVRLLAERIGRSRIRSEPRVAERIAELCARLPLALGVVAARAALYPGFSLAEIAAELRPGGGLGVLADIRAALSWSYQALGADAAALFALCGALPGPDFAVRAAALRVLDHYRATATQAAWLLDPHREPITVEPDVAGAVTLTLSDAEQAMAWYRTEHAALLAAVDRAASSGQDARAWQLAWALLDYLDNQGHWGDWIAVEQIALDAARRRGDRIGEAYAHRLLGRGHAQIGAYSDAIHHYDAALVLYHRHGDLLGSAHTSMSRSWMNGLRGKHHSAQRDRFTARDLYRRAGHRIGEARTLNAIGWGYAQLGEFRSALEHCREALTLSEALDDPAGCAAIWDSIGYAHSHLGDHDEAVDCLTRAVGLYRRVHDLFNEAESLTHLGDAYAAAGRLDDARPAWESAVSILDQLDHPDVDAVRGRLKD